jgi:hypothetical protein
MAEICLSVILKYANYVGRADLLEHGQNSSVNRRALQPIRRQKSRRLSTDEKRSCFEKKVSAFAERRADEKNATTRKKDLVFCMLTRRGEHILQREHRRHGVATSDRAGGTIAERH